MSVSGGMSKGERNRIKIRVRPAMASHAQLEGHFLGGRPGRDVVPKLDEWICLRSLRARKAATVHRMLEAQMLHANAADTSTETAAIIRDCDANLARYRAAGLYAGVRQLAAG
jgi:hypothetical protein